MYSKVLELATKDLPLFKASPSSSGVQNMALIADPSTGKANRWRKDLPESPAMPVATHVGFIEIT
jgi:hypothetical protein